MEHVDDECSRSSLTADDDDDDNLHDLIGDFRWDDAMSRTNTCEGREEMRRKNEGGRLPLHRACFEPAPCELVESLLEGYKEAVRVTDNFDKLPLHHACARYGGDFSPRVVRLILDAYPEGVKAADGLHGWLPLHYAALCEAPSEVLTMLIDAHPEGVTTRDDDGQLPLHLLAEEASPDKKGIVEKVELLLRPLLDNEDARLVPDPDSGETPLDIGVRFNLLRLHACLRIPRCPAKVVVDVTRRHPGQLRERDEDGSLPLHVAAANPILNGEQFQHECVVDTLVNVYPEAAAASNGEGRFPLSLAIESGKRWEEGVNAIADAAEYVMKIMDVGTNLFPFMLAASRADPCITTVYELLRGCPEVCKKP